jgi:hypothetical protein
MRNPRPPKYTPEEEALLEKAEALGIQSDILVRGVVETLKLDPYLTNMKVAHESLKTAIELRQRCYEFEQKAKARPGKARSHSVL